MSRSSYGWNVSSPGWQQAPSVTGICPAKIGFELVVTARVDRVLKPSPKLPLAEGNRVRFIEEGGTLLIGRTVVDAVVPWARPFQVDRRYLLFSLVPNAEARRDLEPEWQLGVHPHSSYEDQGPGSARRVQYRDPIELDEIEAIGIDAAALRIQQHLHAGNVR